MKLATFVQTFLEIHMQPLILSALIASSALMLCVTSTVNAQTADPAVKKSESGICHDKTSSSYGTTKKFEAFANMDACLKSGGRAPANAAAATAEVLKSQTAAFAMTKAVRATKKLKNSHPSSQWMNA
jgi:hypothetical protein